MCLHSEDRALFVDGIGHLDQYGSYVDTLWDKGVVYFVRDYLVREIERRCECGAPVRSLVARLSALNSDILLWEQHGGRILPDECHRAPAPDHSANEPEP